MIQQDRGKFASKRYTRTEFPRIITPEIIKDKPMQSAKQEDLKQLESAGHLLL